MNIKKYRRNKTICVIVTAIILITLFYGYYISSHYKVAAEVVDIRTESEITITTFETPDGNIWDWENEEGEHFSKGETVTLTFLDKGDGRYACQEIVSVEKGRN